MEKGIGWLVTVWSAAAVMAAGYKIDSRATTARIDTDFVKVVKKLSPEQQRALKLPTVFRKDIGSVFNGTCGFEKFWTSFGSAHTDLKLIACGMNTVLS
ncbi:MAG: hypothetical protein ABIR96_06780 [Bdellovibrionota bacterium]